MRMRGLVTGAVIGSLCVAVACGGRVGDDTPQNVCQLGACSGDSPVPGPSGTPPAPTATSTSSPPPGPSGPDAGTSHPPVTAADCATGGNVLVFDGQMGNYIYNRYQKITDASRSGGSVAPNSAFHVTLDPATQSEGLWWDVDFFSGDRDTPLAIQTYSNAERYPFQHIGHPGFDISGDGRGCNEEFGTFTIAELTISEGVITHLRATFEQHCEAPSAPALFGCVNVDLAAPDAGR